jgi:hypothetical protein
VPDREIDRAALEVARSQMQNVLYDSPPTGSERERGTFESYPSHVRYGSNAFCKEAMERAAALKATAPDVLKSIAQQRGYYSHPVKEGRRRSDLVSNYRPQVMESWTSQGELVQAPVLGNGTAQGSKFEHVQGWPRPPERKRISDVRPPPRLPSGEVDFARVIDEQNAQHGHVTLSGRRNVTANGIGPRMRTSASKDYDEYPRADPDRPGQFLPKGY